MNEAFFSNSEREMTLVENDHFDEALDISQDSTDDISSDDEGDCSPVKHNQISMKEFISTSTDEKIENLDIEDSSRNQQNEDGQKQSIKAENAVVPNAFYDEKIEVNDDLSIETNQSEKQTSDITSEKFQSPASPKQLSTLAPTGVLVDKRVAAASPSDSSYQQNKEEQPESSSSGGKKEPRIIHDSDHKEKTGRPVDLSPELVELFQCIDEYKPSKIEIEPRLKCFIPPYIPAIGEVDPFIKVPRPDKVQDGLGITVIDEPAAQQSDAAVLELQLRTQMKKKLRGHNAAKVRSIEDAARNKHEVDKWIQSVEDLHISKPLLTEVKYKKPGLMPSLDQMMRPFPEELQSELSAVLDNSNHGKSLKCQLLDPQIDLSLEEYAKFICTLLDVPVVDGGLIQSLHYLFNLCYEYQKDLHGDAISIL